MPYLDEIMVVPRLFGVALVWAWPGSATGAQTRSSTLRQEPTLPTALVFGFYLIGVIWGLSRPEHARVHMRARRSASTGLPAERTRQFPGQGAVVLPQALPHVRLTGHPGHRHGVGPVVRIELVPGPLDLPAVRQRASVAVAGLAGPALAGPVVPQLGGMVERFLAADLGNGHADKRGAERRVERTQECQVGKGDPAGAIASFKAIGDDASIPEAVRNTAKVRAAWLLVDTGSYEDVSTMVEAMATPTNAMRHAAREALGLAAYKAGDMPRAREWFEQVTEDAEAPRNVANRAQMMLDNIKASGKAP